MEGAFGEFGGGALAAAGAICSRDSALEDGEISGDSDEGDESDDDMDIDETDADEIEAEIEMRAEIDGARTARAGQDGRYRGDIGGDIGEI